MSCPGCRVAPEARLRHTDGCPLKALLDWANGHAECQRLLSGNFTPEERARLVPREDKS